MKNISNHTAHLSTKRKKGFTLAELLIAVAIIGILTAISVPIFSNQLRRSRLAANQANARTAVSLASAAYLTNDSIDKSKQYTIYPYLVEFGQLARKNGPMYRNPERLKYGVSLGTDISAWKTTTEIRKLGAAEYDLGKKVYPIWWVIFDNSTGEIYSINTWDHFEKGWYDYYGFSEP